MEYISYGDIQRLIARAPLPPANMNPTLDTVEAFQCPVCLEVKIGQMVSHANCGRLVCASCIRELLDALQNCPTCRDPLMSVRGERSSTLTLTMPTRAEQITMDQAMFECPSCQATMKIEPAKSHHKECPGHRRHQPPSHIPPRGVQPIERVEVISNAYASPRPLPTKRLVMAHFNGRQVKTKFFPKNKTAKDIKSTIATISETPMDQLKLFKFSHREIWDNETIDEIASEPGITHLAAFTDKPSLAERSAVLAFEEVGPPHVIPPPERPPRTSILDWTQEELENLSLAESWD